MTAERDCDGVVCFAAVDWWYHSQGHSERRIMVELVKDLPVLWVNPIAIRAPRPGKTQLAGRRVLRKLRSTLKGYRRDPNGIRVLSPLFVPVYNDRFARVNGVLLRAQVAIACRLARIRRPSCFVTLPTAAHAVTGRRWHRVVFNRSDNYLALPGVDGPFVAGLENRLLDAADEVLYVNRDLMAAEVGRVRRATYLGHGVDFAHFAHGGELPEPAAMAALARPVVGFYGALDEFTIDRTLLEHTARALPDATLLLIGTVAMDLGPLEREPNVVVTGPIPYEELPAWAARFDVGIMPWLRNEWIRYCNPIKLKEYLAAGFPVVSIDFPELAPYHDLVRAVDDAEGFVAAIRAELAAGRDDAGRAARQAAVADSSWVGLARSVRESLSADR